MEILNSIFDGMSAFVNALPVNDNLFLLMLILINIVLIILVVSLQIRVGYLTKRYDLFMRGHNGAALEDNMVDLYRKIQTIQNREQANKDLMKMMNRGMNDTIQKTGLIKYNAFDGMGGESSFALALLNMENTGFILNAMHSRNSCYLYIKEVHGGKPDVILTNEEKGALDIALDSGYGKRS